MPDLRYELDTTCMVSEGDEVAAHSIVRGTHTGEPLFGAEPSGNELVWTHSDFVRIADGKIVERWTATDMLTLFQQAGVLPAPEEAASHSRERRRPSDRSDPAELGACGAVQSEPQG